MKRKDGKKVDKRKHNGNTQRNGDFTPKEEAFVSNYLLYFNATKAGRLAGYKDGAVKGWELLREEHIRDEIDKRIEEREKRLEYSADDVLKEYIRIATFDPAVLYDEDGEFVGMENLNPQQRSMIKSLKKKTTQYGIDTIVETYDKMEALNKMTLHFGIMLQKIKVDSHIKQDIKLQLEVEELKKLGKDRLFELNRILSTADTN